MENIRVNSRIKQGRFLALVAAMLFPLLVHGQDIRFDTLQALTVTTPIPGSSHAPLDFDGDGLSDQLLFNPMSSQMMIRYLGYDTKGRVAIKSTRTFNVSKGYFVGAVGDFNGDGLADIMFTSANRDLYLWTNTGQGGFVSQQAPTYPAGWQIVGAGDTNGDGFDDLLWMDQTDCQFGYWTMHGAARTGVRSMNVTCGYYPLALGYFTPSNRLSVMWTNATRDAYVWDSQLDGSFKSYPLGAFPPLPVVFAGGGVAGAGIAFYTRFMSSNGVELFHRSTLTRSFDGVGVQSSLQSNIDAIGGATHFAASGANFVIESWGGRTPGLVIQIGNSALIGCAPGTDITDVVASVVIGYCGSIDMLRGWFVVGAPANGIVPGEEP